MPSGTLFVVATPIGNLEDLTFRALRVLREVDLIAAEDTRRTAKLLARYEVRKPLTSLHEHNEATETARLVTQLEGGQNIALVSDAGTPAISDPGAILVREARDRGVSVIPVPGPSAPAAALSASGLSGSEYVFMGFPPRSGEERSSWFGRLQDDPRPVVFFEAPHRIIRTLETILSFNRKITVFRELSKVHEEQIELLEPGQLASIQALGEFTVVVWPSEEHLQDDDSLDRRVVEIFCRLTDLAEIDEESAEGMVAWKVNIKPTRVRKIIKKHRISVKQLNHPPA